MIAPERVYYSNKQINDLDMVFKIGKILNLEYLWWYLGIGRDIS